MAGAAPGRRPGRPYLAPVPDTEPPFDTDRRANPTRPARFASRPVRTSPLRAAGSADMLRAPASVTKSAAGSAVPSWSAEAEIGVRRTTTAELPAARRAAQMLSTALVEVLSGRRPVGQLRVHTAPGVFAGLVNRTPRGWSTPAQASSVHLCQPAGGVVEVSATVRGPERVHAIAFRMEGVEGRWRITALDIG